MHANKSRAMPGDQFKYTLSPAEKVVVQRAFDYINGSRSEPLALDERAAMRAFLQRGETRLSTYQRVAGVFLNGAGLLVLLPAVARDTVQGVLLFATSGGVDRVAVLLPWAISIGLPLYAILLLLRDLVEFYFSPTFLSKDPVRITRFSLAGLTFSYDEGVEAKAQIVARQSKEQEYADFVFGEDRRQPVADAYKKARTALAYPMRHSLVSELRKDDLDPEVGAAEMMTTALARAGSMDSSLVEEVARIEASIARHVLHLRRLVLRYTKALILFVWTTLTSLVVVAMLSPASHFSADSKAAWAFGTYACWAATSVGLIRLPRRWIDRLAPPDPERPKGSPDVEVQDPDIHEFESRVTITLVLGTLIFLALMLATLQGWL